MQQPFFPSFLHYRQRFLSDDPHTVLEDGLSMQKQAPALQRDQDGLQQAVSSTAGI